MTKPDETQEQEVQRAKRNETEKKKIEKLLGTNMAWFGLAKIALQAGSKIYANRQKTKMAMSDAQLMHAEKMARGRRSLPRQIIGS